MIFCSEFEPGFKKQIIDLLYDALFKMSSNGCLEEWYDLMTLLFDCDNKVWEYVKNNPKYGTINLNHRKDALFECKHNLFSASPVSSLFQYPNFGHNVPVWLEDDDNNSKQILKILIVFPDPLRERGNAGNILFSSPFGVHCKDYRNQRRECVMKFIEAIWKIAKERNIKVIFYLTDLIKFFCNDKGLSIKTLENNNFKINETFKPVLSKEIDIFKPNLILCSGSKSIESLLGQKVAFWDKSHKYNGIPVLPSIHIAGIACHSWKNTLGELPQTATAKAEYIYREIEYMIKLKDNVFLKWIFQNRLIGYLFKKS